MSEALTKAESVVVHAAVRLLCKRMESNPEEFLAGSNRWYRFIKAIREHGSKDDVAAMDSSLYHVRMGKLHQDMLAELLDPKERGPEERETEAHLKLIAQLQAVKQNAAMQNAALQQPRGYGLLGGTPGPDSLFGGLSNNGDIL